MSSLVSLGFFFSFLPPLDEVFTGVICLGAETAKNKKPISLGKDKHSTPNQRTKDRHGFLLFQCIQQIYTVILFENGKYMKLRQSWMRLSRRADHYYWVELLITEITWHAPCREKLMWHAINFWPTGRAVSCTVCVKPPKLRVKTQDYLAKISLQFSNYLDDCMHGRNGQFTQNSPNYSLTGWFHYPSGVPGTNLSVKSNIRKDKTRIASWMVPSGQTQQFKDNV